jgi:hypothetical protein
MNRLADRAASQPPEDIARRLEREGIACSLGEAGLVPSGRRFFTLTICGLEATDIRRLLPAGNGLRVRGVEPDDRLKRILARAAVRALYAMGMDSGQIDVSVDEGGKPLVCGVSARMSPTPGIGISRTRMTAAGLQERLAGERVLGLDVRLGADPEFVLLDPAGRLVSASRFLPPGGMAGCDSVVRGGIKTWPLVELRPEPSAEPAEVVSSLRRLMEEASRRIGGKSTIWRAGAWPVRGLPLGGHIHISGAALTADRLRALDLAVALPLRLLEPPGAEARRPHYGTLGDFRRQPHGGFEYRTPPSWLVSPQLALGSLALAKIAAEHDEVLTLARPLDHDEVREAFYGQGGEERLREEALRAEERIRSTPGYRKYAAAVDFIFDAVRERARWDDTPDIRRAWGIR